MTYDPAELEQERVKAMEQVMFSHQRYLMLGAKTNMNAATFDSARETWLNWCRIEEGLASIIMGITALNTIKENAK